MRRGGRASGANLHDEDTYMPKMKNHSGAKKRFRVTAKGKYTHRKAGRKHLLTPVSASRKHDMRATGVIEKNSLNGRILQKQLPVAK